MKNEMITLRVDLETKEKLQELAERQDRTVSNYIQHLISMEIMKSEIGRDINLSSEEITAIEKALDAALISYDEEFMAQLIRENDVTINKARNGRYVAWVILEEREAAVYVDTLEELTPEEIEKELM